jgi:hypothetical protein
MFYESFGMLLEQSAQVLSRDVRPEVGDERVRTQLDAVAALAADIGALWPALFRGLEEENRILAEALGTDTPSAEHLGPIERHRALVAQFNERLQSAAGRDPAAVAALRDAIAATADVQRAVMESASNGSVAVRRI